MVSAKRLNGFRKAYLLIKEAADGSECLSLAEKRPAVDIVAIDGRIRFEKGSQGSNAEA